MIRGYKYGDLDPEFCYFNRNEIWRWAVREFIWPSQAERETNKTLAQSYWFDPWCNWLAGLVGSIQIPSQPLAILEQCLADLKESQATPDGWMRDFAELQGFYHDAWQGMLCVKGREAAAYRLKLESGSIQPAARMAGRGLKFCLIILLFRYGSVSARVGNEAGRMVQQCVTWDEALEASSFLLALSVLAHAGRFKGKLGYIPWPEVVVRAEERRQEINKGDDPFIKTDPGDVRGLQSRESIEGFKQRLAATLADGEWGAVKKLAAAFLTQGKRTADKWAKDECIYQWFPKAAAAAPIPPWRGVSDS